jgi:hypothetical protein
MRSLLKYGVPAAAGLATGGYALSQGEDPGSAILAGAAGTLGGAAGLLAARGLAGKYAPGLREAAETHLTGTREEPRGIGALLSSARKSIPADRQEGFRAKAVQGAANMTANVLTGATDPRGLGKIAAAGLVPASALAAGLGGVALGAVPGSMGMPGFQQGMAIDPESPGSSNTQSAKYGVTPYATTRYM